MNAESEANVVAELSRHLQNTLDRKDIYNGIKLDKVEHEKRVNSGYADVVVGNQSGDTFLVIEAKKEHEGTRKRNIDPFSSKVVEQAYGYAGHLGARLFATYNRSWMVVFETDARGKPLLDRQVKKYKVKNVEKFVPEFLEQVTGLVQEKVKWDPEPQVFVSRLQSFHEKLSEQLDRKFGEKIQEGEFKEGFSNWVEEQGWDVDREEERTRFINQASYLLMNKLLFYEILSESQQYDTPTITPLDLTKPESRIQAFKDVTERVDFEAIYEQDPIFDQLPLTNEAKNAVRDFLEELEHYDLQQFDHDTIGYIYEKIIPPKERHALGQYYTPPEITELITKLTIESSEDEVLDPGCGSGTFLISAYNKLKELKDDGGAHNEIIEQLWGIDINKFPAHLTAINLALQNLDSRTEKVDINVDDFFEVRPGEGRHDTEKADHRGKKSGGTSKPEFPERVDAVVANPPYIRQENIRKKELCREHLSEEYKGVINQRSDIFVYFFTHATDFLKEQGRIGFITSDKWLTVGYGKGLQEFFLDHFKIEAIISFTKRQFEDPLVPTCVTILEKCDNPTERAENPSKFIRIKKRMNVENIIKLVEEEEEPNKLITNEEHRIVTKKQSDLRETKKWNRYLVAPDIYWKLLKSKKTSKLENVATEIKRGITTGVNDFFHIKEEEIEAWGMDETFFRPLAKSIRQVETLEFTENSTDICILDVNDYITSKLAQANSSEIGASSLDKTPLPSSAKVSELSNKETFILYNLFQDGYDRLYDYITHSMWEKDWGRYNPPQQRPTCQQHRSQNSCWFNLGNLQDRVPDIIFPSGCRKRLFAPINRGVVIDKRSYEVYTDYPLLIGGILNSDLQRFFREMHARWNAGLNEITVYETKELPTVDISKLEEKAKEKIASRFEEVLREGKLSDPQLNDLVMEALGLEKYSEKISAYSQAFSKARREGTEVEELVEKVQVGEVEELELEGAEEISGKETTKGFDF